MLLIILLVTTSTLFAGGWPERATKENDTLLGPVKKIVETIMYTKDRIDTVEKIYNTDSKILSEKNISDNEIVKIIEYQYLDKRRVLVSEYHKVDEDGTRLLFTYERIFNSKGKIISEEIINENNMPNLNHNIGLEDDDLFVYPRNCSKKEYDYIDENLTSIKFIIKDTDKIIFKIFEYESENNLIKNIYGFGVGSLLNGYAAPDIEIYQKEFSKDKWPIWTKYIYLDSESKEKLEPSDYAIQEDNWLFSNVHNVILIQNNSIKEEIVFSPFYGHDLFARKYYYNEKGLEIEQKNYSQNDCKPVSTFKINYIYDAYGNWIEKEETRIDLSTNEESIYLKETRSIEYW